jgi:tetratricopeptide (TPR) repeat protein
LPSSLPTSAAVSGLDFYPQSSDQCGPESLATVLSGVGRHVTPEDLSPLIYLPSRGGTLGVELKAQARQQGLLVYPIADIATLLANVAAGHPAIILQNLRFNYWPKWHFAVVIAYDLERNKAVLRSGLQHEYDIPLGLLERTWQRAEYWGIIVLSEGELPASVNRDVYLQSAADLEQVGQQSAAYKAYLSALDHWPDSAIAWFGLGNTAYSLGYYSQAQQAYTQLLSIQPEQVGAWNNLAYAYQKMGCGDAARRSIQCGLALAPSNEFLQLSETDISSSNTAAGKCPIPQCSIKP